jgi:hypothetical protein
LTGDLFSSYIAGTFSFLPIDFDPAVFEFSCFRLTFFLKGMQKHIECSQSSFFESSFTTYLFGASLLFFRFKTFGGRDPHRPAEDVAFSVARFFQKGGSVQNYYMVFSLLIYSS